MHKWNPGEPSKKLNDTIRRPTPTISDAVPLMLKIKFPKTQTHPFATLLCNLHKNINLNGQHIPYCQLRIFSKTLTWSERPSSTAINRSQ